MTCLTGMAAMAAGAGQVVAQAAQTVESVPVVGDPYVAYVFAAYISTAVILAGLIWTSLAASRRARRALARDQTDGKGTA